MDIHRLPPDSSRQTCSSLRVSIFTPPGSPPLIRNVLRVSCKLIHSFLTRQLLCLPKNTPGLFWWISFPLWAQEFGTVTGLPCGPFPAESQTNTGKAIVAGKTKLTEIVIQLTKQLKQLRRVMKRRNKRSHGRQSSFHATLPLRKKSYASPHPCQHNNEGDAAMETDELPNKQHDAASEPDELPESLSPIISQYAAQLQRDQIAAPQPVCNSSIHTPTVHMITTTDPPNNDELDDYDEPPRTPVTVQPPWSQLNSVIYDKSEHPNSLEIHHILYHGVRIYDSINPDPPIFDSSIPPASPRRSRLLLSPLPTTPLSSPTKISDNVAGFAVHAATVNAFAATASSNSPPCLGSRSFSPKESVDGVVDLTNVKDTGRHVPTLEENHLAQELSRSPLIPALAVISPLPELEWDLFYNIISQKKNLAKPKQWTTTHQMEILIHMVARRYSTILTREKSAFITPLLVSYIQDAWSEFKSCRKRDAFVWDQRLLEIVLQPGKKWMDDIHIIYTPMLWGRSHWVGLAINLDMWYVEILDPLPDLHADRRVKHFMQPLVTILPYLVKKVAMCELTQFSGLKKFVTTRIPDLYINTRSGDCGPVSMKFLEMHALGDPAPSMGGITDKIVDDFRK
ncbi:hypothetical protein Bca52824_016994 [Brassica carinata]|uniref:Ubiquitin-like protease family profile domain-containing protein n=1 Tax=Brassica carinata TaxID=52824 RepID=A0A8X8AXU0_BRACI|nr:hypothetical protein Bca52824_016994 [Brassica carinata]